MIKLLLRLKNPINGQQPLNLKLEVKNSFEMKIWFQLGYLVLHIAHALTTRGGKIESQLFPLM